MLDLAHEDTLLDVKRQELIARLAEGHQVIDALTARQSAMGRKIDETLENVQRLREQVKAIDTVMGLVGSEVSVQPQRPTARVLEVVPTAADRQEVSASLKPQRFRPLAYLKCMSAGHVFMNSRSMPGYVTCRRCHARRKG